MIQEIDPDDEFSDPNLNYRVLMSKLRTRINDLEKDVKNICDPVIKGLAVQELIETRETYFGYLKIEIELQHLMLSNPEIYGIGDKNESI